MLPSQLQSLIEEYCMGMQPTDAQIDEIMDLAISLSADSNEVAQYMEEMQQGPTKEDREAIAKAEGIVVSEEDLNAEYAKLAEMYKMEADKVKETVGEEGKKQIMTDLAVSKAVELVVNEAKEK